MNVSLLLIKRLKASDVNLRRSAAESAGRYLYLALPAVPALIKALDDEDKFVRRHCATSLGKLGAGAKSAIPKLIELLDDDDPVLVEQVCWALGRIGRHARRALPALRRVTRKKPPKDDPWWIYSIKLVREAAQTAVDRIQKDSLNTLERASKGDSNRQC